MKNIFKINPLTYILIIICICIGYFKFYLKFMLVLIIHELGHLLFSIIFKWKIAYINILPFGALIKFENSLNKPLFEEFIIAIMGIVFQTIFIIFFNDKIFWNCYRIILIFNIIPIYPLDGAKIINILFNKIVSFRLSYIISLIISYVILLVMLIYSILNKFLVLIIAFIPLLIKVIDLIVNRNKVFTKFLLERYLYRFNFKKIKIIKNIKSMKRDYKHIIKDDKFLINEEKYLQKMFE